MSNGSVGVNTSTIIHVKRPKRKKEPCNCNICINNYGKGCHLKKKPNAKGFCWDYKINYYATTDEEKGQIKKQAPIKKKKSNPESKEIKKTSFEMLSKVLDTQITKDMILQSCERSRRYVNANFKVSFKDPDKFIVHITGYGDKGGYYQIIK